VVLGEAHGDPIYRVKEIPIFSTSPTNTTARAYALNNACEVVGECTDVHNSVNALHGFLWVPVTNYGITGQTIKDLNDYLASGDQTKETTARDINSSGQIAGRVGASLNGDAYIWQPGQSTTAVNLTSGSTDTIIANAVNESGVAVGQMWFGDHPHCTRDYVVAFSATWTSGGTPTVTHLPPTTLLEADAQDINGESTPKTVGSETPFVNGCVLIDTFCGSLQEGAQWPGTSSPTVMDPFDQDDDTEDFAQGNNDEGNVAGYSYEEIGSPPNDDCLRRAVFRESASTQSEDIVDLHSDADPGLDEDDESLAEAVNEPLETETTCLQVVGQNITDSRALLWQRDDMGDWTVTDLNDLIWTGCGSSPLHTMREALDINDDGEIAGIVDVDPGTPVVLRAALLVSVADITTDGQVDGADSGQLLLQWGNPGCGGSTPCASDFNCDGKVDGADQGILLLAWGNPVRPVCSGGESFGGGGGSNAEAIETILSAEFQMLLAAMIAEGGVEEANDMIVNLMEGE